MRKYILVLFLFLFLFLGFNSLDVHASDDKNIEIVACNLSFQDSVKIMYAVDSENIDNVSNIKILIWESFQDEYLKGTEDYALSFLRAEEIEGKEYAIFLNQNVKAKQMTDDFYAVAYYNDNGNNIYSDVVKYSIIQYAKNMKGSEKSNDKLDSLIDGMLEYGALTQKYFDYNLDRLANDTYYEIKLENGLFLDNTNHGLFLEDEEITFTSNIDDFGCWLEENNIYSVDRTIEKYKVLNDSVLTSTTTSQGLEYVLINDDKEYEVKSCGTCEDDIIIIPATFNNLPITSIGSSAFYDKNITSLVMTDNIKTINSNAFKYCGDLKDIVWSKNVETIGDAAFYGCWVLNNIDLGENLVSIGEEAFQSCASVKYIDLPESLEHIGFSAFCDCESIESITIPGNVEEIHSYVFKDCTSLKYVILKEGITSIYSYAFLDCTSLKALVLPSTISSCTKFVFDGCTNIEQFLYCGEVGTLNISAYSYMYEKGLYYYSEMIPDMPDDYWRYVDGEPKPWVTREGFAYKVVSFPSTAGVTRYDYYEFSDDVLVIPTKYYYDEVDYYLIKYVYEFYNVEGVKKLYIPNAITDMGDFVFSGWYDLEYLYIGNGITDISIFAFSACMSLKEIILGDGVETIGKNAFQYCEKLEKLYYMGSEEDWNEIFIDEENTPLTNATRYYYSEEEPLTVGNYWHYVNGEATIW